MIDPEIDSHCVTHFEFSMDHETIRTSDFERAHKTKMCGEIYKKTNKYVFPSDNVITYASIIPPKTDSRDRLINFYKKVLKGVTSIMGGQINKFEFTFAHYQQGIQVEICYNVRSENIVVQSLDFTHMQGYHPELSF